MNRGEIIRMAREAGLCVGTNLSGVVLVGAPAEIGLAHLTIEELERFAALVAAHEREACAAICDRFQARDVGMQPAECAGAIRARGNT